MTRDTERERDEAAAEQAEEKAAVNPAARRDRPGEHDPPTDDDHPSRQVPPVQREPLDPLGPGGIGG